VISRQRNVNFRLLNTIYVVLLVCYLNKLQNARCNDKDGAESLIRINCGDHLDVWPKQERL